MNIKQLNEIPIVEFLEKEGIYPARKVGRNSWYISPIRAKERSPSFKVDDKINRWYDHGIGEGGKLFDLALRLYQTSDVKALIEVLNNHYSLPIKSYTARSYSAVREPLISIEDVRPLGFHQALVHYLNSRGIDFNVADQYCKDVTFKLKDKTYFAVGFQNRSGGFELRNSLFKGSSSPKDITIVRNKSDSVNVLEGFMDFLSMLKLNLSPANHDHLILNSVSFASKSLSILREYKNVKLFLHNDESGVTKTGMIQAELHAEDLSYLYKSHNDINDLLKDMIKKSKAKDIGGIKLKINSRR
ncbi:MAG TPA: toprim domain-containing protein [Ohtaekwangia sp.]|nr:toprim domain-containing protein [Ohtaekwangia sp.]